MKIVDLSLPIHTGMEVYAGDPPVAVELVHTYERYRWQLRKITMGTHTGTHVDAFSHMDEQGETLDDIPLNRFFGRACLVEPGQAFPAGVGLFFRMDANIDLLKKILDAQAPFVGGLISLDLERALLRNKVITYTNLINLDLLPAGREFSFLGLPLRLKEGDGSPVRAVAIID